MLKDKSTTLLYVTNSSYIKKLKIRISKNCNTILRAILNIGIRLARPRVLQVVRWCRRRLQVVRWCRRRRAMGARCSSVTVLLALWLSLAAAAAARRLAIEYDAVPISRTPEDLVEYVEGQWYTLVVTAPQHSVSLPNTH